MTPAIVALVLSAAVLHASWNALVKSSGNPVYTILGLQTVGAIVCACIIPFLALPLAPSWPMIIASVIIHNIYYVTLSQAYRAGDLSQVYPVFRGLAPILVTVGAGLFASEWLPAQSMLGIFIISIAIMSLAFGNRFTGEMPRKALMWGLITSVLIAGYTIVDGLGVRESGSPLSYICWLFVLEPLPIGLWLMLRQRDDCLTQLRSNLLTTVAGGIAASLAYGLVIFAMSLGAMGIVSSLRETSVIIAALIGSVVLKESFGKQRIIAAILVAAGVIILRLSS